MPNELGAVRWHGSWAPEHPVQVPSGTLNLYLSMEDAVYRILTRYPLDTKPDAARVEAALRERAVHGMRFLATDPLEPPRG